MDQRQIVFWGTGGDTRTDYVYFRQLVKRLFEICAACPTNDRSTGDVTYGKSSFGVSRPLGNHIRKVGGRANEVLEEWRRGETERRHATQWEAGLISGEGRFSARATGRKIASRLWGPTSIKTAPG